MIRNLAVLLAVFAAAVVAMLLASPRAPALARTGLTRPQPEPNVAPEPQAAVAVPGAGAPWRVGLQIGHLDSAQLPAELSRLRGSTGAYAAGVKEVDVNRAVAEAAAELLQDAGVDVTVLPATVPPGFAADAFVSVHADGNRNAEVRGYKISPPWRASPASRKLVAALLEHYGASTGLPRDLNGVTYRMRGYYAFNSYRYRHAIRLDTPAAILEMGYISNGTDREYLLAHPEEAAAGMVAGILAFLDQRDPFDRWDTMPIDAMILRAPRTGIALHAGPDRASTVRLHLSQGDTLYARGGVGHWYDVRVQGSYRHFGWVHADDLGMPPPE
ncbi:MAG: N-acetylmuramoyl-L-alanine amidase [Spirochaetaceae bacterium]|nr:N-acetylmuramoyl-L-alanine amidase [Spirochaetaceae bacterium]